MESLIQKVPISDAGHRTPRFQDAPCMEKLESGKGDEAPPCSPAGNIAEEPSPLSNPSWELFYHRGRRGRFYIAKARFGKTGIGLLQMAPSRRAGRSRYICASQISRPLEQKWEDRRKRSGKTCIAPPQGTAASQWKAGVGNREAVKDITGFTENRIDERTRAKGPSPLVGGSFRGRGCVWSRAARRAASHSW